MIRHAVIAAGLVMVASAPVAAQDLRIDAGAIHVCLEDAGPDGDKTGCIGIASGQCMDLPGGYSTYGMSECLNLELQWWDAWLNAAYKDARAYLKQNDTALQPPLNVQAQTLLDMQRAWIAFRDAKCGLEVAMFQGGTGAGPAQMSCMMHLAGAQALYLSTLGPGG